MANYYISKIGTHVGPHNILEACDRSNVSGAGYAEVYKKFKGRIAATGRGLKIGACLPNPHQVSILRKSFNSKLHEFVEEYYSLHNTMEIPRAQNSTNKKPLRITLNDQNNLFLDVECVQRTMVNLCNVTPEGEHLLINLFNFIIFVNYYYVLPRFSIFEDQLCAFSCNVVASGFFGLVNLLPKVLT
jgi:hypothetical protein